MKKMKLIYFVVLVLILLFSLVTCKKTSGDTSGKYTIRVLLSEEREHDPWTIALHDWEAASGNKVDIMVIPYDDQLTKFPAMAKQNDLPDLISTTRLHQLYPDEFLDMSKVVDLSEFEETAVKIVGKDYHSEKITGLPFQFTITNMYYNKDALKKAGIEAPTVGSPWTWEELYKNAAILQDSGAVKYGFACDPSRARYDNLMYANGGSLVEKSGKDFVITVNSPQNIATLERFIKANNEVMPKAIWSGGTADNPGDYFKNGDVGIYLSGSWNYNNFVESIKAFDFGIMPTPKGSKSSSAIIGGTAVAVPKNGKNKEGAIAFVKWLYENENFQTYLNNEKGLSSLKNVIYQPEDKKMKDGYVVLQAEVKSIMDAFMIDESSAWRKFLDNEYRDTIKLAVSGQVTAKKALDSFANELSEKSGWAIKK